jgi:hypothetical protein
MFHRHGHGGTKHGLFTVGSKKQFVHGPLEGRTALPSLRKGYASIALCRE